MKTKNAKPTPALSKGQLSENLRSQHDEQGRLIALIRDLETPAIVVAKGVLLAPVVGSLDQRRAEAISSHLLRVVYQGRVRHTILDVAGARQLDGVALDALLQIEQALRLLGCSVTITGISASVALQLSERPIVAVGAQGVW